MTDDRLCPESAQTPGANGMKLRAGWAWISVTDRNLILRAPVREDGAAGPLEVAAENCARTTSSAEWSVASKWTRRNPTMDVRQERPNRLLKKSPRAGFEAGFIAIMEADLAGERAVIVKFCKAVAAGFVHFVVTLPGEVGAAGRVGAIEAGGDATEEELARSLAVEGNVGGLEHVEEVGAPHLHRRDAPFAFQACSARHDGAAMSLGRRIRL